MTPILILGAGRMGGSLLRGWMLADAFQPSDIMLRDPAPGEDAHSAVQAGCQLNPADETLAQAKTLLLAVKPQIWREAAAGVADCLPKDAVIVSIAAGVKSADIAAAFGGRRVARVMPTTGVGIGKGVASIHADDADARGRAHALFDPVATTVDLDSESLMDAATAVSGSGPAYLYAFIEALEAAGAANGLAAEDARKLARCTVTSAAALLDAGGEDPAELRRQVTSPGGTTEAALKVLLGEGGLNPLLDQAVAAAIARARALGA